MSDYPSPPPPPIPARGLKIGMHIPHMDGSKVTYQIFDILPSYVVIKIDNLNLRGRLGRFSIFPRTKNALLLNF